MFGDIMQPTHLLLILAVALLVLGPKRLPEVGRQLGKGIRDFRGAINGEESEHHADTGVDHGHLSEVHEARSEPVEHQFASETTAPAVGGESEANGATTEPVPADHEFAHEPAVQVGGQQDHSDASESPSETGADKPVDPLT